MRVEWSLAKELNLIAAVFADITITKRVRTLSQHPDT